MGQLREGFTLLEVVLAVTILSIAGATILFIASKNIERVESVKNRIDALSFLKAKVYSIDEENNTDFYLITDERELDFGIKEKKLTVKDREGKEILKFFYYEK